MKVLKLVTGILCMILFLIVILQSCAVGFVTAVEGTDGDLSSTSGLLVAVFMLTGGIVQVATRKNEGKGGSIACLILFAIAAVIGLTEDGMYGSGDLVVWSGYCAVLAVINFICLFIKKKKVEE